MKAGLRLKAYSNQACRLPVLQLGMTLVVTMALLFFKDNTDASGFLLGGLISVVPTYIFARRLFLESSARQVKKILMRFYLGELYKLLLIGIMFVVIMRLELVRPLVLILGFVTAQLSVFLAFILYGLTWNRCQV